MSYQSKEIKNVQSGELSNVKGPEMNDRDMLNDVLSTEKYLTDSFNVMTRETSFKQLFNDVNLIQNETQQCARKIFNLMFEKGWYKLQAADQNEIQQTQQDFSNYHSQFPFQ